MRAALTASLLTVAGLVLAAQASAQQAVSPPALAPAWQAIPHHSPLPAYRDTATDDLPPATGATGSLPAERGEPPVKPAAKPVPPAAAKAAASREKIARPAASHRATAAVAAPTRAVVPAAAAAVPAVLGAAASKRELGRRIEALSPGTKLDEPIADPANPQWRRKQVEGAAPDPSTGGMQMPLDASGKAGLITRGYREEPSWHTPKGTTGASFMLRQRF